MTDLKSIAKDGRWTLFLDRDGVINVRIPGVYINDLRDFCFEEGAKDAIARAATIFRRVFVVTNQQGIGKRLMTTGELEMVHSFMREEIEKAGGRLDGIYYCPAVEGDDHPHRKPNPGMAYLAKQDFPEVDFSRSIMIGDRSSDILFGKNLGMTTVLVTPGGTGENPEVLPDLCCKSLAEFISLL